MLKLTPKPTFEADVAITVPGEQEPGRITLTFNYMPKQAVQEFFKKHQPEFNKKTGKLTKEASKDDVMLREMISGWKGMDVEYSHENLSIFLDNYPAAAGEIVKEYHRLVLESRVKN
jgi:hypothetical protein